jgi:hypothetical protein
VPKSIAGETTKKMTHKEVGICRRYVCHKEMCIREKLRCGALDIQVQNLVHKQDLCTIQKKDKGIPCINSKKALLIGHFLWDMRSRPKSDKSDKELETR